jgi:hypothetical protein
MSFRIKEIISAALIADLAYNAYTALNPTEDVLTMAK